jgi:stress-induced morphogen
MSAARFFTQAVRQLRPLQPTLAASRPKTIRPSLVVRAMSSDGGQITSELVQRMQTKIQEALQAQRVEVADMAGDGRHVEIVVIAKEFEGKSAVNRQRMVYKVRNFPTKRGRAVIFLIKFSATYFLLFLLLLQAIWEELQETVHAVDAMITKTPEEAGM